ncbi:prepilin-type N-terminal cleavage/methylation domain-containing protein [Paradesulfitobacterium aromaticivorans]
MRACGGISKEKEAQSWVRGATLLELLLVLVILAGSTFVLGVKLPGHLQSGRLAQASTQLLEELRDARQAAMSENTWYQVRFFYEDKYYQILRVGTQVRNVRLPDGVSFVTAPQDLQFNAAGIPNVGMTILLRTKSGEERKVIVAPVAGRIREE